MDVFRSQCYKTNWTYLRFLGLWPHDDPSTNRIKRILVIFTVTSFMIPQSIRFFEEWREDVKDMDVIIELIASLMYFSACQIKFLSLVRTEYKMKYLYSKISKQWKSLTDPEERKILHQYAETSRKLTLGYIIPINVILLSYLALPLVPLVLDVIKPLNETRQRIFPYYIEYFIDDQKYFLQLSMHGWVVCSLSVQIFATFDTNYNLCVHHVCALFAIVERRLQKATMLESNNRFRTDEEKNDTIYKKMVIAVHLHQDTLGFVNVIEDCFSLSSLFILLLNTSAISLAAVIALLNFEKDQMKQFARFIMLYFGFILHMLFNMYPGQKIVDSSANVQNAAFHCEWYNTCPKTRQLIKIVMLRTSVPCQLSACKMITLDLENFAKVFQSSVSLITVIASTR